MLPGKRLFRKLVLLLLFLSSLGMLQPLNANNIRVSQVALLGQDVSSGHVRIRFDLGWDNSWRLPAQLLPANRDAAWVFAKFRIGFVDPIFTVSSASSGASTLTVSSTDGLRVGMPLRVMSGTGSFAANSTISSIDTTANTIGLSSPTASAFSNARVEAARIWEHAWLHEDGHQAVAGSALRPGLADETAAFSASGNPVMGLLVYRNATASGSLSLSNLQMRWNYREQGVTDLAICDMQVFAVEMVWIPQGSFLLGSGGSESNSFTAANSTSGNTVPFEVTSTPPTLQGNNTGSSAANLGARGATDLSGTATASLASGFPTGYDVFYVLKYEISQQQYVDFLNTLNRRQQDARTGTNLAVGVTSVTNRYVLSNSSTVQSRNGIRCDATISSHAPITFYCDVDGDGISEEAEDGRGIACNFLSWADVAAYLDWAGLRPLTELEFEKAGRGERSAVPNSYAWGNSTLTAATAISSTGTTAEVASNNGANAVFGNEAGLGGPLRTGSFATPTSGKTQSGAGEYGLTELSGNLWERTITVGNATGRAFTALHGNGTLGAAGLADVTNWPDDSAVGTGARGGGHTDVAARLRLSDRDRAATAYTTRDNDSGGRGARSAPSLPEIDGGS